MIIRKAFDPSVSCNHCRLAIARAFISSLGLSVRPTILPKLTRVRVRTIERPRVFTSSQRWRSDVQQQPLEQNMLDVKEYAAEDKSPSEGAPSTPWYLQVEPPQPASNPLLERQRLPPLPPDPPPLLKPMLKHISIELGLDDLTLFDLRSIDPPPALGANLLMVIGTARSEKHLHVSADRFCRWLKTTYSLSPYADGLLGRGELKLKLRRKARRARLLSNVGSSESNTADDGIRTGWICVNVGMIQDGRDSDGSYSGQEGYVGFGSQAEGAKVVVQMLIQEKREELDLEDLWGKMLKRHERKEGRINKGQEELQSNQELGESSLFAQHPNSDLQTLTHSTSLKRPFISSINQSDQGQRRSMSSTAAVDHFPSVESDGETSISQQQQPEQARDKVLQRQRQAHSLKSLRSHVSFLRALPRRYALKALGRDLFDFDSTTFLKSFYGTYPQSPGVAHWHCKLALISYAVILGHPGYTKERLLEILGQMQSSVTTTERTFLLVFRTLLSPNPVKERKVGRPTLTKESICSALVILNAMHSHGYDIETTEIRKDLETAVKHAFRDRGVIRPSDPDRLKVLLDNLHSQLHDSPGYPICLRLLIGCCDNLPKHPKNPLYPDQDQAMERGFT